MIDARSDRAEVLERIARVRQRRALLTEELRGGSTTLGEVFGNAADPVVGSTKLTTVLINLPALNKIRTKRLLERLGISDELRIADVPAEARRKLLASLS